MNLNARVAVQSLHAVYKGALPCMQHVLKVPLCFCRLPNGQVASSRLISTSN